MPKARTNKTAFNIMIVHFIFVENWIYNDTILNFSVWLRTGSIHRILIGFEAIPGKNFSNAMFVIYIEKDTFYDFSNRWSTTVDI